MTHVYAQWDLLHDDLAEQSGGCITFLVSLIS
jgi:hypothetical protein